MQVVIIQDILRAADWSRVYLQKFYYKLVHAVFAQSVLEASNNTIDMIVRLSLLKYNSRM